jgi:prepilin-type N-terminal cleavage/methylation domain-containing protein
MYRSTTRHHRQGFTLVELLVVIAIVAVIISLLLPAAQKIRMASARTQTLNNLRQIGIAIQNHHHQRGYLPGPGRNEPYSPFTDGAYGDGSGSWACMILPYMDRLDIFTTANGAANQRVILKEFLCAGRNRVPVAATGPRSGSLTDYAINCRLNMPPGFTDESEYRENQSGNPWYPVRNPTTGASTGHGSNNNRPGGVKPQANFMTTWDQITDGLTNTLLVGSKLIPTWKYNNPDGADDDSSLFYCRAGVMRNGRVVAQDIVAESGNINSTDWGSPFEEGCPILLCDGSARLVRFGIDLAAIGLRDKSDGVIPPGDY